jgi:hypothetical protein
LRSLARLAIPLIGVSNRCPCENGPDLDQKKPKGRKAGTDYAYTDFDGRPKVDLRKFPGNVISLLIKKKGLEAQNAHDRDTLRKVSNTLKSPHISSR